MTLEESMDAETQVSRIEAINECKRHGQDPAKMVEDLGEHAEYKACDVLFWLGY